MLSTTCSLCMKPLPPQSDTRSKCFTFHKLVMRLVSKVQYKFAFQKSSVFQMKNSRKITRYFKPAFTFAHACQSLTRTYRTSGFHFTGWVLDEQLVIVQSRTDDDGRRVSIIMFFVCQGEQRGTRNYNTKHSARCWRGKLCTNGTCNSKQHVCFVFAVAHQLRQKVLAENTKTKCFRTVFSTTVVGSCAVIWQ